VEKNRQLKQLLAEKELDILGLRTALSKSTDATPATGSGGREQLFATVRARTLLRIIGQHCVLRLAVRA
jgi:hypothetical protein